MLKVEGSVLGLFITIEGVEGSGKTTLVQALDKELAAQGLEVIVTAEPGGDALGTGIRKLLLDSSSEISDRAELLLFEAARAQHIDNIIRPALERGAVVVCDRFTDSSIAYQGYARGISLDIIEMLNDYATGGLRADLTILLDLPARDGLGRQETTDRFSAETPAFHEAVREGYLSLVAKEPGRFVVIDATMEPGAVVRRAMAAIGAAQVRGSKTPR